MTTLAINQDIQNSRKSIISLLDNFMKFSEYEIHSYRHSLNLQDHALEKLLTPMVVEKMPSDLKNIY